MYLVDFLGYFAACCTTLSFIPQAIKAIRHRDTKSLSLGMYVIFTVGISAWLGYGLLKSDYAIILANVFTLILSLAILATKIRFDVLPNLRGPKKGVRRTPPLPRPPLGPEL